MASVKLSRRVEKVVGYPPLSEMSERHRREFHEALLDADGFARDVREGNLVTVELSPGHFRLAPPEKSPLEEPPGNVAGGSELPLCPLSWAQYVAALTPVDADPLAGTLEPLSVPVAG